PPPCDEWGTPYFFRWASPERVRACLDAGAAPATPNPDGVTPLHLAAHQNDNPVIVTILVEAGADPNAPGPSGLTPLHMTWSQSRSTHAVAVVRELLRLGADPLALDDRGRVADPTHCDHWNTGAFARIAVREDFVRCLEQGADVFAREDNFPFANDGGYTVLHHATANEDPSIVALLVDAGADLEARNDHGYAPLHSAIGRGNLGAMSALLDAGANVEAYAGGIWGTPLISAAMRISGTSNNRNAATMAMIDALLAAGADVNAVDEDGDTPLLNVLRRGRTGLYSTDQRMRDAEATADSVVDLALKLLEAGADPGAQGAWGQTPLHEAAEYRTPVLVQTLVAAGADPNERDEYGSSPLHRAARLGTPEIIGRLVAAGAEVNGQSDAGTSPLHSAVIRGTDFLAADAGRQADTPPWRLAAAALIEAGADPNLRDAEGDTPLHLAGEVFDTALVSLLTDAGADVNARNDRGETPLVAARSHANEPVARKLLDLGADASVLEGTAGLDGPLCDLSDYSFLLRSPAESLRDCLEAGFPLDGTDGFGQTPLVRLSGYGAWSFDDSDKVELLLAAGADANARAISGRTSLHIIAEADTRHWDGKRKWTGNPGRSAAAALLDAGADVNARDTLGETPLHKAVRQEDDSATFMVTLLLEAGADVSARSGDGRTPLHLAASLGRLPAMAALLEAGAGVDARTTDGRTPLHLARQGGWPSATAALLEAGADPAPRDLEGRLYDPASCERWGTPVFFAFATVDVVTGCLDAGADPHTIRPQPAPPVPARAFIIEMPPDAPLHAAAEYSRDPAVITALVQAGADVNARGAWDNTPLHDAAEHGTPRVVRALLAAGAEVDARPRGFDSYSGVANTPLHHAARNPDPEVTAALLEAGADVNAQGARGVTPLHYAAWNRDPAVAELLLAAGAEVNAGGSDGITPLHNAAAGNPNPAVFAVLLGAGADVHARGAYDRTHSPAGRVTPLHNAAYWNSNPEIVAMLVAAGADPDGGPASPRPPVDPDASMRPGDFRARSPISLAASNNPNPAVIEALVRAGADLELTGSSGQTVLHSAASYAPHAFPLLLRLGTDPGVRDAEGKTPMDYARENPLLQPWERVRMSTLLGRR
ncbi:MAG: hypothetical protein F4107_13950, partial [Gemmatimonadetes bacterium]|nr:hypothetical protein [Gemmatimonadota bacterium]